MHRSQSTRPQIQIVVSVMNDRQVRSESCRPTDEEWGRRTDRHHFFKAERENNRDPARQTTFKPYHRAAEIRQTNNLSAKTATKCLNRNISKLTAGQQASQASRHWHIHDQKKKHRPTIRCCIFSNWSSSSFHWCLAIYLHINSRYTGEFMNSACLKDCCFSFYSPPS